MEGNSSMEKEGIELQLIQLYQHAFNQTWISLMNSAKAAEASLDDDADASSTFLTPDKVEFFIKTLQSMRIFPSVYLNLAKEIFILIKRQTFTAGFEDVHIPGGESEDRNSNCNRKSNKKVEYFFKTLQIANEILDNVPEIPSEEFPEELKSLRTEALSICKGFINLLVSKVGLRGLAKSEFMRVLLTFRKLVVFLKPDNEDIIFDLKNATEQNKELFIGNERTCLFFRFLAEVCDDVPWKLIIQDFPKDSQDYLTILIPILQKNLDILDNEIVDEIRTSLTNPERQKEASFILKSLTVSVVQNQSLFFKSDTVQNKMMGSLGRGKYVKFWSDFFDLYEILDEKQSHIIEPVLKQKLYCLEDSVEWQLIIIWKMIRHDNRLIAKDGFLKFLAIQRKTEDKENFEVFLKMEILPFLKDHVGWILSESSDFFNSVENFSSLLKWIWNNDEFDVIENVLTFINEQGKCFSPVAVFFFVESIHSTFPLNPEADKRLVKCLGLITRFLSHGMTTVDKFIRLRVEQTLVFIVSKWTGYLAEICGKCTDCSQCLLDFLGALTKVTLTEEKIKKTLVELVQQCGEIALDLDSYEDKGIYRWFWLSCFDKPNYFQEIYKLGLKTCAEKLNVSEAADWSKNIDVFKDFLQLIGSTLKRGTEDFREFITFVDTTLGEAVNEVTSQLVEGNLNGCSFEVCKKLNLIEVIVMDITCGEKCSDFMSIDEILETWDLKKDKWSDLTLEFFVFWKLLSLIGQENGLKSDNFKKLLELFEYSGGFAKSNFLKEYENCFGGRKLSAEYYQVKFSGFANLLNNYDEELDLDLWSRCIQAGLDQVEMTGPGGVVSATKFFNAILYYLDENQITSSTDQWAFQSKLESYMDLAWNLVFEMRKTETFWIAMKEFVNLVTNSYFLGKGILLKFATKIFDHGETISGLPLVLVEKLEERISQSSAYFLDGVDEIIDICVTAMCFGPPLAKNNRVVFGLWEHLKDNSNETVFDTSNFSANAKTRLIAIRMIYCIYEALTCPKTSETRMIEIAEKMPTLVMKLILQKYEAESQKRYFGNSVTHRKKQRIAQGLTVLLNMFPSADMSMLLEKLLDALAADSPQPSVRYFCEWIVARIVSKYSSLWDSFFKKSSECWKTRVGFGAFFSSICLQTTKLLTLQSTDASTFYGKALALLSELVLGSHTTVRVYSQVCFQIIWNRAKDKGFTEISSKYQVMHESLLSAIEASTGNAAKLLESVSKDFYVQIFDPQTHFTPETVFIHLPKLAGIASDELPLESDVTSLFSNLHVFDSENVIEHNELKMKYQEHGDLAWHIKNTAVEGRELGEEVPSSVPTKIPVVKDTEEIDNFQKKINPWKSLAVTSNQLDDYTVEFVSKKRSAMEDGLIVVASLIDRVPNLGGLCRSCEIFGVSKYVLPSMKILEDQQFISLSVSAHNWVDILEVPVRDLESFLGTYAAKGYTILGIEQALESTKLNDFQFPKKSLLLLGNEKYGIPTNLLHLVDKCLEIPQVGVIRSLNVHVSGALCIWQYASQHSF